MYSGISHVNDLFTIPYRKNQAATWRGIFLLPVNKDDVFANLGA